MTPFTTVIAGRLMEFETFEMHGEIVIKISFSNQSFLMEMDDDGVWRIKDKVPSWIKEAEEEIRAAIQVTW